MKIRLSTFHRRAAGVLVASLLGLSLGRERVLADFSGAFAPGNFQLSGGTLNNNAPVSIQLNGSVPIGPASYAVRFLRAAPANGRVAFNWSYGTSSSSQNQFGYEQNGSLFQVTNNGSASQNGATVFPVAAGGQMGFWLNGSTSTFLGSTSASAAISNFLFSTSVYWKGNTNGSWAGTNWTLDQGGTIFTAVPDAPMDVVFSAAGAANKATTLGQDFTIRNLTVQDGTAVSIGTTNVLTVTGTTSVGSGSLALQGVCNSAAHNVAGGAILELNVASGTRDYATTSFSGGGTLRKTGSGTAQWGAGVATFALGTGGLIDVQAGQMTGGSNANDVWTNNLADLNVASGAVFNGVESNVRVDVLTGSGSIKSGYPGAGYVNFTFGVDNGSGTFGGVLADSGGVGNFVKTGTGTQTLTHANTYSGTTTIAAGTIAAGIANALPNGTTLTIGQVAASSSGTFDTGGFAHTLSGLTIYAQNSGSTVAVVGSGALGLAGDLSLLDTTANAGNCFGATIAAASGGVLDLGGALRNIVIAGQNNGSTPGDLTINAIVANGGINFTGKPSSAASTSLTGMTLGASAPNTYAMGTTVNAGTLNVVATTTLGAATGSLTMTTTGAVASAVILNSDQTIGSLATGALGTGSATVTLNAGTLTVNQVANTTYAGVITGVGAFLKSGSGMLTLSSVNTYAGTTTIAAGSIAAGIANALPNGTALTIGQAAAASSGTFDTGGFAHTLSGLTIYAQNSGSTVAAVGSGTLRLAGDLNLLDTTANAGNLFGATISAASGGVLDLGGALRNITIAGQNKGSTPGDLTINAIVTNGGINFTGKPSSVASASLTGMTLGASAPNTYAMGTIVNAGTLNVGATTTLGAATGSVTLNTTGAVASAVILNSDQTIGSLATGALGTGSATVTLNAGTLTVNQATNTTYAGVINGSGALFKTGAGALTLTGVNAYTGGTTVAGGTLNGAAPGPLTLTTTGAVASTVVLNSSQSLTSLQSGALGSAAATLNLNGSGVALTLNQPVNTTFAGLIAGTGSLVKNGAGTLTLAGSNTYGGGTTLSGGSITTAGRGLGSGAVSVVAGRLNIGGISGLASLYYNSPPVAANFNSLDALGAHLGSLAAANLVANAPTLNFGSSGAGFPAPYNSGATNFEGYFSGILNVTTGGVYTFNTSSDDGSVLWVDGKLVVNNNFSQGVTTRSGSITLSAGAHTLVTAYYQGIGGYGMNAQVSGPGTGVMEDIDSAMANGLTVNSDLVVNSLSGAGSVNLQDGGLIVGLDNVSSAFTGAISASGSVAAVAGLTKFGSGTFSLGGANPFGGKATVNGGILQLNHANALQNASLHPNLGNAVKFSSGLGTCNVGGLEAAGNIALQDLSAAAITLVVGANAASTTYSGILSGPGGLAKVGAGTLTLSASSTYTGGTSVAAGTLVASDTIAAGGSATGVGPVAVSGSGTLAGGNATGTQGSVLGALTVNTGGVVAPGNVGTGILTVNGNTVFTSGAKLQIRINGAVAGSGYDQIKANGSVNLGGSTLSLAGSLVPVVGQAFTLVANDSSDPVSGTFNGLAEGAVFLFNGIPLAITYVGGTGNDVVLTPLTVTSIADDGSSGTLRQIISAAPAGSSILLDPALDGNTITLTSGELLISRNLTIDASTLPNGLTISGHNASRVFNIAAGTVNLSCLTITGGNSFNGTGAGIENAGTLNISRCTVVGNTTGGGNLGGGINNDNILNVTNCTIANNIAGYGGGICSYTGTQLAISQSTICGNVALAGGGGLLAGGTAAAISGTIVARNSSPIGPDIWRQSGPLTPGGVNLIGDNSTVPSQFATGPFAGTTASPLDPQLYPLANYGGPTQTMPPRFGSAAIDPAGGATTSTLTTDQRGFTRLVDGDAAGTAIVDIGAVEAGPILTVAVTDAGLRAAIAAAVIPGQRLRFAAGGTISLSGGQLAIPAGRTLVIEGSGLTSGMTLSGNNAARVFNIPSTSNLTLDCLTVGSGNPGNNPGGGILNAGTLNLVNSTVAGNSTAADGGGIANTGTLSASSSTLTGNTAAGNGGGLSNTGSATLRSTTISANTVTSGVGGGIYSRLTLALENSLVAGNAGSSPDLNASGSVTPTGVNLLADLTGSGLSAGSAVRVGYPLLGGLADNGGLTKTMAFPGNSPAVGAGAASANTPTTDQRGYPRFSGSGSGMDIGAYESGATLFTSAGLTISARVPVANAAGAVTFEISTDRSFLNTSSTLAGIGSPGFADGAGAQLAYPSGVARDASGNIFVADTANHLIRMLTPAGVVSTIAGTVSGSSGIFGFADGAGPSSKFFFPAALAVGPGDGNVYVADTFNHRIRKLTRPALSGQSWTVTTLAGSGTAGFLNGSGSVARFSHPQGLVLDVVGNVYVADSGNHRVRQITPAGGVSTYCGSGVAGGAFVTAGGVTIGTTTLGSSIVAWSSGGSATPVAGMAISGAGIAAGTKITSVGIASLTLDTPAMGSASSSALTLCEGDSTSAQFNAPIGVGFDNSGNLLVADRDNHRIRRIDPVSVTVSTLAGSGVSGYADGTGLVAQFKSPVAVAVDAQNNCYVSDEADNRIRRVSIPGAVVTTVIGTGVAGYANGNIAVAQFKSPAGLLVDGNGNLVVADTQNHAVRRVIVKPITVSALAGSSNTTGVAFSALLDAAALGLTSGTQYFFRWAASDQVTKQTLSGIIGQNFTLVDAPVVATVAADNLTPIGARLNGTVDPKGGFTSAVFEYSTDPGMAGPLTPATLASVGFAKPEGVVVVNGIAYVADSSACRILQVDTISGVVSSFAGSAVGFGNGSGAVAMFDHPTGLAADASGNLYVADKYNHVIRKITHGGVVSTYAGSGLAGFVNATAGNALTARFLFPSGVAVDSGGNVYVADSGNHCIRKISASGAVSTLAGAGGAGFSDGPAASAQFNAPLAVAAAGGQVYVADTGNHAIRVIAADGSVFTLAGNGSAGFFDGAGGSAQFASPTGIAVDGSGIAYVADRNNHRIRRIDSAGQVSSLAGSGIAGLANFPASALYPATSARFNLPVGIALASDGSVFVTEEGNLDVRTLVRAAVPTIAMGLVNPPQAAPGLAIQSSALQSLYPQTPYYFRVKATNDRGTASGIVLSFTTPLQQILVHDGASTAAAVLSDGQTLEFGGTPFNTPVTRAVTLENTGNYVLTIQNVQFVAGSGVLAAWTLVNPVAANSAVPPGGSATFSVQIQNASAGSFGLDLAVTSSDVHSPSLTYHLHGTVLAPPTLAAVTAMASGTTVALGATVNPNGSDTKMWFEISPDPQFSGVWVSTLAGSTPGYAEGIGTAAQFRLPAGLAADALGNVYVADPSEHRIRKVAPDGASSTVAGTGVAGFVNGSSNDATSPARFNAPAGLAIAADGTLFVTDSQNHCIRAVSATGTVTTFSGFGSAGFTDGAGTGARFNTPLGMAIDAAGNLYVADSLNHRIRKVAPDGSVSTLAGTGAPGSLDGVANAAQFNSPSAIAVSATGIVYVTEAGKHSVRRIQTNGTNVVVDTFVGSAATAGSGNGTGTAATFSSPAGLGVDASGNLYVADTGNHRIRKITAVGVVTTYAGAGVQGLLDGFGTAAKFDSPVSLAVSSAGAVWVGEITHATVRGIVSTSVLSPVITGLTGSVGLPVSTAISGLDPATTYYFRGFASNSGGTTSSGSLATPGFIIAPTIAVEEPLGKPILQGGVAEYDPVAVGSDASLTFTISNLGNADLTGLAALIDGVNAADFTVTAMPEAVVPGPVGTTTLIVRFAPSTAGSRTAVLHLASNDASHNPFNITLTGTATGGSPFQAWQVAKFGGNAGNPLIAGALANPAGDGVSNLLKYAFGMNPMVPSPSGLPVLGPNGSALSITYTQMLAATDVIYSVEWSSDLITWSPAGVTAQVLTSTATTQQIRASAPVDGAKAKFIRLNLTLP